MEKTKIKGKRRFPAGILFLCGFLLGMLLPNLAWKLKWKQDALASVYLLGAFGGREVSGTKYLLEIVRMRGSYFFLSLLCGITVFGVPLAVIEMLVLGAEIGALLAMSILQFGLFGGVIGAGLLFPQYLVYLPVMFQAMGAVYGESLKLWQGKGILPRRLYHYGTEVLLCLAAYFAGILLECYVNPWIVERILGNLKIF